MFKKKSIIYNILLICVIKLKKFLNTSVKKSLIVINVFN